MVLNAIIEMTKTRVPIVGWARQAMSAGALPLAACHAAFAPPHAQLGGFGTTLAVCDGAMPHVKCSSQAKYKWPDSSPAPWHDDFTFCQNGDGERVQADLDRDYERALDQAGRYTGTSQKRLRPYLDGRVLTARQARRLGLINEICEEDEAYDVLLKLVRNSVC